MTTFAQASPEVQSIANSVIGRHDFVRTPFGERVLCYADFTASARSLQCVEDFIQEVVMPFYGNTHTTTSITGAQTTEFRKQARQIILNAVNANWSDDAERKSDDDALLFTGPGTTSAVMKLVTALGLHVPLPVGSDASQRPVVFVGPFEHHSNLLPWRESIAQVVVIPENERGQVDVDVLKQKLQQYASRPLKIGAFSAASNLTGVLTDVDLITAILHMHGALAFWDYASCAPYVAINMNPVVADESLRPFVYKDAVYFSGHKFIGGPGSPGVLFVKKRLLGNAVPTTPGGGTVFFVTERDHRYLSNCEEREEGGTPDILGSIRLGLAFEVKQRIGVQHIMELERKHVARVRSAFAANEKVVLLGRHDDAELDQLPIFSFLIRCGDRFLHYNFVCALLNDLFGIQTRGGCQCAGPYATRLLGITKHDLFQLESFLLRGIEVIRPGSSRLSFPYFMDEDEVDFILKAIEFIAEEGWKLLALYTFEIDTGLWKCSSRRTRDPLTPRKLTDFSITRPLEATATHTRVDVKEHRLLMFESAKTFASTASQSLLGSSLVLLSSCEPLRWFVYPSEAAAALQTNTTPLLASIPLGAFQPQRYVEGSLLHQWETHSPLDFGRLRGGQYPLHQPDEELEKDLKCSDGSQSTVRSRWRRLRSRIRRRLSRRVPTSTTTTEQEHVAKLLGAHVA